MADFPTSVPVFTDLVDNQDDVLAEHQNTPNDEINALATMIGALGKTQSWGIDLISSMLNGTPVRVIKKDANTLTVKAGVCWIANSGQTIRLPRRNTADVDITSADIDTGSLADDTYYYVYAYADSVGTTMSFKFSTSATTPTGLTSYELIGWFYNESAGSLDVTSGFVGNVKRGVRTAVPNGLVITGSTDITRSANTFADMDDMTLRMYTSGRPVIIRAHLPFQQSNQTVYVQIVVDATAKTVVQHGCGTTLYGPCSMLWMEALSVGTHTITIQWKGDATTTQQYGTQYKRILTAYEL